jgi:GNAT superfamily N-acetyltransferase
MAPVIVTIAERPDLEPRLAEVADPWPEFLHHDETVNARWDELYSRWPEFQLARVEEDGALLGKGCTMPVESDGDVEALGGGVVEVFERNFPSPNVLCAIVAIVDKRHQGRGLSGNLIGGMADVARSRGLECLIAPVRPTWKERYPLIPLERYMRWQRDDGLPFDPWIRLHHRLGAEILAVAPRSLDVRGTVAEWEEWTAMAFPETGQYVVEGALVPVTIDREHNEGRYIEPNVWMRHAVRQRTTERACRAVGRSPRGAPSGVRRADGRPEPPAAGFGSERCTTPRPAPAAGDLRAE